MLLVWGLGSQMGIFACVRLLKASSLETKEEPTPQFESKSREKLMLSFHLPPHSLLRFLSDKFLVPKLSHTNPKQSFP